MNVEEIQAYLPDVSVSARASAIVASIDDETLRAQIDATVRLALVALADIERLHLPQDNAESRGRSGQQHPQYQELAPYVLAALVSINRLLAYMFGTFPVPASQHSVGGGGDDFDFDVEFDLVDGPTGDGAGLSSKAQSGVMTPAEQAADAAHAFGSMLKNRVLGFGDRLRHALAQRDDSWTLLAELDEFKHRLKKSVQGVLFGVLGVFSGDARREEILPEYRSAAGEAVALRTAIFDLSHHISRFNEALSKAAEVEFLPLAVGIADQLRHFAEGPAYHAVRAEDKRAIIDFRTELNALRHTKDSIPLGPLRRAVEGFDKFLESMHAVNHREVLVLHDRQRLAEALEVLEALTADPHDDDASEALAAVVRGLYDLRGRNPELDAALRAFASGGFTDSSVADEIFRWHTLVLSTLSVVG